MREILFRGKAKKSGSWVYGNFVDSLEGFYIAARSCSVETTPVESKSVGQYTGFKDKNGTKIFEGDILELKTILFKDRAVKILGKVVFEPSGWSITQEEVDRGCIIVDNIYDRKLKYIDFEGDLHEDN